MNNRVTVYTVLAVMVGYLLISAVPGQVERYVAPSPVMLTGSEEAGIETGRGGIVESRNATDAAPVLGSGEEATEAPTGEPGGPTILGDRGVASFLDLYKWWVLDLIARRRFS